MEVVHLWAFDLLVILGDLQRRVGREVYGNTDDEIDTKGTLCLQDPDAGTVRLFHHHIVTTDEDSLNWVFVMLAKLNRMHGRWIPSFAPTHDQLLEVLPRVHHLRRLRQDEELTRAMERPMLVTLRSFKKVWWWRDLLELVDARRKAVWFEQHVVWSEALAFYRVLLHKGVSKDCVQHYMHLFYLHVPPMPSKYVPISIQEVLCVRRFHK